MRVMLVVAAAAVLLGAGFVGIRVAIRGVVDALPDSACGDHAGDVRRSLTSEARALRRSAASYNARSYIDAGCDEDDGSVSVDLVLEWPDRDGLPSKRRVMTLVRGHGWAASRCGLSKEDDSGRGVLGISHSASGYILSLSEFVECV